MFTSNDDTETLLRLIQSIPSPKAEPIKQWLATVGAREVAAIQTARNAVANAIDAVDAIDASPSPTTTTQHDSDTQDARQVAQAIANVRAARPDDHAPLLVWADYYRSLAALYERQATIESQVGWLQSHARYLERELDEQRSEIWDIQGRVESLEEGQRLLPELLERLGPQTLTPAHQAEVRRLTLELQDLTGMQFNMIYGDLKAAFHVAVYRDIPEARWDEVAQWFAVRLSAARKNRQQRGERNQQN